MDAEKLDKRVAILRRAVSDESNPGVTRGDFAIVGTFWASVRARASADAIVAGVETDATLLTVRVRDFSATRLITIADKFRLSGTGYAIQAVSPPDRIGGFIEFTGSRILPSA